MKWTARELVFEENIQKEYVNLNKESHQFIVSLGIVFFGLVIVALCTLILTKLDMPKYLHPKILVKSQENLFLLICC